MVHSWRVLPGLSARWMIADSPYMPTQGKVMLSIFDAIVATVLVAILYLAAAYSVKEKWGHRMPLNPLKIIAGVSGRASLSNAQVFFFTLLVAWLAIYWVVRAGALVPLNNTVLGLLGIAVVGAGASKATAIARFRVTGPNWAWAINKGWIQKDFTRSALEPAPKLGDLFTSDQGFEIAKFQAVVFSLIIGISLLYKGATVAKPELFSQFEIDEVYLGLIGISQGVYVGGKMIGSNLIAELNQKLDKVRELELAWTIAVAKSPAWLKASAAERVMKLAREHCAAAEYAAYKSAVTEASGITTHLTGVAIEEPKLEPDLPSAV
jgi:hypothetical protein